jgi:hypothetical protein
MKCMGWNNKEVIETTCSTVQQWNNMQHGTTMKIINAQQARMCNNFKSTKLKLPKVKAAIWFYQICWIK